MKNAPDRKAWRADAKLILDDLRRLQDEITAKYGYEGFSAFHVRIDGIIPDAIVTLEFRSEPGFCVVSHLVNDERIDSINIPIPE